MSVIAARTVDLRRRRTELGLLILAGVLTAAAYTLASLGRTASLPADLTPFLVFLLVVLGLGHLGVRSLAPRANPVLLPIAALLNGLGYVFIARLDTDRAAAQATWTALGVAALIATLLLVPESRRLDRYRYTAMLAGLVLLLLPLVPRLGYEVNGARLWIRAGSLNFQPGEIAKVALAIFFASYLVERGDLLGATRPVMGLRLPDPRLLGPVLLAWAVSLVVMTAERDLGSSLLFFTLFVVMLWMASGSATYLALGGGLFVVGALSAWAMFDHVQQRVQIWLDPWPTASGRGYQVVQAAYALGTGGIAGTGIALGGAQRIPAAETDFILAAIGEELGLIGTTAVLAAFLLLVGAGLGIARRARNSFDKLLAAGLATIIGVQAFTIIGGVTRLVPLTGITLPFVSYGGSSLLANYVLLGLLLRISDDTRRAAPAMSARAKSQRA